MEFFEWEAVQDGPIVLDFSGCQYADDIHPVLRKAFGFPMAYGENWSALEDFLDDFFLGEKAGREVRIYGLEQLSAELRRYCSAMKAVFERIQRLHPQAVFRFMS